MARALLGLVVASALAAASLLAWWTLRPNRAQVDPALRLVHWDVVADGSHNSNTDLVFWRDHFLLVHAASPWHLGSTRARLVVRRSVDGRRWEELATLRVEGQDIRDPKLAVIGGRLFLYALPNDSTYATPDSTVVATSTDGVTWSDFEPVEPEGWLFWRPRTRDGRTWYVPAYWREHGEAVLLRSTDGRRWKKVSTIHRGEANDETAIAFLPDGRMLATARLEVEPDRVLGHAEASTALAVAHPPYRRWQITKSTVTRLDGPVLFRHGGRVYAVARHQPGGRGVFTRLGSTLARKRTSLYLVEPERLVRLSDLPSAGDTSYAGAVLHDGFLWTDYYTSRIDRDYPWLLGMFLATDIRMARIPLEDLEALAQRAGGARDGTPRVARPAAAQAFSERTRLSTLPVGLRGSSSMKTISRGTL